MKCGRMAMKFKVWFFSPELEHAVKGWGETNVTVFAANENETFSKFRAEFPDEGNVFRSIEVEPEFRFCDNVEMRGVRTKKTNFTLEPSNPHYEEFFTFEGVVHQAHPELWNRAAQTMLVWNGRFDWIDQ
jgi:hypothetical protein